MYKKDQQGIINRYYRETENWNYHIKKCKSFIKKQIADLSANRVAVFGSGWLLDVPIKFLTEKFDEVWLFDINHPTQVKQKYSIYKNIKWISTDLTNGMIQVAEKVKTIEEFMYELNKCELLKFNVNFDFVISINLLNQLDIILCDFLIQKFNLKENHINAIRQKIQQNHVNFLLKNKRGILITDSVELRLKKTDIIDSKKLIYSDLSKLEQKDDWIWVFDTNRLYDAKFNVNFSVQAFIF